MNDDLFDPKRLIRRRDLEACAAITRVRADNALEGEPRRYVGLLLNEVQVGAPLVLLLDKKRRFITSTVHRIDTGPEDTIYVDTANSRYCVRRLIASRREVGAHCGAT